ncbi:type II toxin-antitoxin system Phd/YefM family antitoxin [Janthinobacterium agaricidamnosum]|uniref:Antitoxin n=1 Tax=Janthinobacterium agaricidamnosum NBRC 102515 = DSM 9628 TaxID=1349767 RepID=W0V422_9BURK|nr:type II toxin-antitoxin system Phd/YefM family antitoxin [Janthinobacterium agaricidamnosum]CDG82002.1 prevent-host-death family protein [Janthinobacterium agaricidamnosum NBRC 102515 = DSM 9628]
MKTYSYSKPISYLQSDAGDILKDLSGTAEPLVITQDGQARLVVMDVKIYEEKEQALALLKILSRGEQQIQQGKFRDAEDVFADVD